MGIKMAGLPIRLLLVAGALTAHAAWADQGTGVCSKVEALQKDGSDAGSIESLFKKEYPGYDSCASWLTRSCLSPFKLDKPGVLESILSQPWKPQDDRAEGIPSLNAPVSCGDDGTRDSALDAIQATVGIARKPGDPIVDTRARFAHEVLDSWRMMERKREEDFQVIQNFIQKHSIPRKFSMDDSPASPDEVSGNDFKMAISTLVERLNSAIDHDPDADTREYLKEFVGQQIIQASQDLVTRLRNGQEDRQPGMYSRLLQEPDDRSRFNLLMTRAYEMDASDGSDVDGFLTSYHAKMLLLYYIDNQIHRLLPADQADRALDDLAQHLQLKLDYTPKGEATQWQYIVPHDGFVLGATPPEIRNLWATSFRPDQDAGTGSGTDCTTFLQSNLARFGYPVSENQIGSLDSGRILQRDGALRGFSTSPLELNNSNASELEPGDILVFGPSPDDSFGHAETVVGYQGDPPQLTVVSAKGGYVRGIIKRTLDIFPQAPTHCDSDSYFSEYKEPKVYRVRLTRPPGNNGDRP